MRLLSTMALVLFFSAGTSGLALAQQLPGSPGEPSSIPHAQSLCADGFQSNDINRDGLLTGNELDRYDAFLQHADDDSDGVVTQTEFNAGCAENLFERQDDRS